MNKILPLLVVLVATISGGLATIAPTWLEEMDAGQTYTYGQYLTKVAVAEDAFTPQQLTSSLTFSTTGGVDADVDQTINTNILGISTGIDRQLLTQAAAVEVIQGPGLKIDAENDAAATTLVMNLAKQQNAIYSGKLTGGPVVETTHTARDWNGDGVNDDYYGGNHDVIWKTYAQDGPAWTTTFNDAATVSVTNADKESVSLKQSVVDAKVTISAEKDLDVAARDMIYRHSPSCIQGPNEFWQGYATAGQYYPLPTTTQNRRADLTDWPAAPEGSTAQLTELSAGISSTASLEQSEMMWNGNIIKLPTTIDGSATLSGAFEDAIVDAGQPVNVDLDGDIDIWWE